MSTELEKPSKSRTCSGCGKILPDWLLDGSWCSITCIHNNSNPKKS